jgi:hypothetical protein
MISFCMPRPITDFNQIVESTVDEIYRAKFSSKTAESQMEKAVKLLAKQIKASFEDI